MLDQFFHGVSTRLSPEAPVPIVKILEEQRYPGGAANVAENASEFAKNVKLLGAVGDDSPGEIIRERMVGSKIDISLLSSAKQTITKTRLIINNQHLVRADREIEYKSLGPPAPHLIPEIESAVINADAIIFQGVFAVLCGNGVKSRLKEA